MKKYKRVLSLLMAGVMTMSMVGTAFATGETTTPPADPSYEATETYVLNFNDEAYFWGTDLDVFHNYRDDTVYPGYGWGSGFLHDSVVFRLTKNGDTSIAIPTYCADADTTAQTNGTFDYRRINLEDAAHFSEGAAPLVRSIVMNTFPNIDVETLAAAANQAGFAVEDLTMSEALSASQQAIWKTIHGDNYTIVKHYDNRDWDDLDDKAARFVYPESIEEQASEHTEANVTNIYNYLMSLKGTAPKEVGISSASFGDVNVSYATDEATGTLTATVKATVSAAVKGDTALALTAIVGGKVADTETVLNGTNEYELTIPGLAAVSEITLAIDGVQTLADVFLFDAEGEIRGGRATSQSLVGYDSSTLPVHAETKIVENERIINIHKQATMKDNEGKETKVDLANIVFEVYFVGTLEDYLDGKVEIKENPDAKGLAQVASIKTDKNGMASLNLTRKGLEDGVYLISERQSAATTVESLVKPFYVLIPYTSDSGDSWEYVINANPKNTLIGGPEIVKDVTSLGNDHDTFDVDEAHTWIISADKPADIADGIKYEITDKLDSRLTFVEGSVKVAVEATVPVAENTVNLVADTDYTAAYDSDSHTLVVSLTEAGMDKAAAAAGDNIRVYFDTKINSTAGMDEQIPNTAALEYINSTNYTYSDESDTPEVHTGGFCLVKVDGNSKSDVEGVITYSNKLAGAEFTLYREATETEIADAAVEGATIKVEEIKLADGTSKKVIAIDSKISDAEGSAEWAGLAYGTYYLVETKAPAGYNLLLHPAVVTIGNGTATTPVTVENFGGFELPSTGGIGTTVYTLMGSMTMAASGMYIFRKKRED